jgi:hypothetical protein
MLSILLCGSTYDPMADCDASADLVFAEGCVDADSAMAGLELSALFLKYWYYSGDTGELPYLVLCD